MAWNTWKKSKVEHGLTEYANDRMNNNLTYARDSRKGQQPRFVPSPCALLLGALNFNNS